MNKNQSKLIKETLDLAREVRHKIAADTLKPALRELFVKIAAVLEKDADKFKEAVSPLRVNGEGKTAVFIHKVINLLSSLKPEERKEIITAGTSALSEQLEAKITREVEHLSSETLRIREGLPIVRELKDYGSYKGVGSGATRHRGPAAGNFAGGGNPDYKGLWDPKAAEAAKETLVITRIERAGTVPAQEGRSASREV